MYKGEFIRRIAEAMRLNDIRKPVSIPKQVFHISDDEGNSKDFFIKKSDKAVLFKQEDVEAVIDAAIYVIEEALKQGETVSIRNFGSIGLKYRKPRKTIHPTKNVEVVVRGRYSPKFTAGDKLKKCAMSYETLVQDALLHKEDDEDGDD